MRINFYGIEKKDILNFFKENNIQGFEIRDLNK